jgi:ATP-dependent DNA helicase RecG
VIESESNLIEYKRELGDVRQFCKTACAFANTHGGKIIIGLNDGGDAIGFPLQELDSVQKRIAQVMRQVVPTPYYDISTVTRSDKNLIVVEIEPMSQGALCSFDGSIFVRRGSTNEKAEGRTLQELLLRKKILNFENTPSQANLDEVDNDALRTYLGVRSPSVSYLAEKQKNYLMSLEMIFSNGKAVLNQAGVLFFCKDPGRFIPQAEMKLVRFKGYEPVDIMDVQYISKPLVTTLDEAESFVRRNTRTAFEIEAMARKEVPEYPINVVREALVNAVAHRDYSQSESIQVNIFDDRMEVINPGALPEGLRMEDLGGYSVLRNPIIYRRLKEINRVEGLSTGIPRIRSTLKENGYPEPKFEELGSRFFRVTIKNRGWEVFEQLNARQLNAIGHLRSSPYMTSRTYAEINKVSQSVAITDLNEMMEKGLVLKVGKTRGSRYILSRK